MDVRRLIGWMESSARHRTLVTTCLVLGLFTIGALDSVTGSTMSFGVLYVLLVVALTVVAGARMGVAGALLSAVIWGTADIITSRGRISIGMDIWNLVTRFGVHVLVVLLIAAVFEALRAATESDTRSRAFLATAAHQLRTPIAALGASVEALLLEGSTPSQERLLANVAGETSRLGRLAASLLRTARLDQGEPLRPQAADLRELLRHEVDRARQLSVAEYRLTVQPDVPERLVLDPDATSESVSNLLDNARRHAASLVEVEVSAQAGKVVVAVRDDGPGLPTGAEKQAFDRFVTLDGRGGTGLGLAIARDLARRQGGELTYVHKTFVLTLPLTRAAEPAGRRSTGARAS